MHHCITKSSHSATRKAPTPARWKWSATVDRRRFLIWSKENKEIDAPHTHFDKRDNWLRKVLTIVFAPSNVTNLGLSVQHGDKSRRGNLFAHLVGGAAGRTKTGCAVQINARWQQRWNVSAAHALRQYRRPLGFVSLVTRIVPDKFWTLLSQHYIYNKMMQHNHICVNPVACPTNFSIHSNFKLDRINRNLFQKKSCNWFYLN